MKNLFMSLLVIVFISCSTQQFTPAEVAQLVVESFYQKDNSKLKRHTTPESYESFISIQGLMTASENGTSNFSVVQESVEGDTAWIKFTTSYEDKPETFKLTKVDGMWKVTEKGRREKAPF
jgi:hypothetical protein